MVMNISKTIVRVSKNGLYIVRVNQAHSLILTRTVFLVPDHIPLISYYIHTSIIVLYCGYIHNYYYTYNNK